jgi:endonuclease/exonuclease/phosphatase family metal-dependent hydrolase
MKRAGHIRPTITALCAVLSVLCLCLLTACDSPDTGDEVTTGIDTTTNVTVTTDTPDTTDDTVAPLAPEGTTEAPQASQPETLPETDKPSDPSAIDLDSVEDPTEYFVRPVYAAAEAVHDEAEGRVISLSTKSISGHEGVADPYVYLRFSALAEDVGYECSSLSHPYLVLKVKSANLLSTSFSVFGYTQYPPRPTEETVESVSRLTDTSEWQYVAFDLSSYDKELVAFRLDFEASAASDGEQLLISEIRLCATAEEAGYKNPLADTYPLPSSDETSALRVMSFNVQTENGTAVQPLLRAEMLRTLIDDFRPDSIGMQEVTRTWQRLLDEQVFNASYAGVGEERGDNGEKCAIYYRSDVYDLIATETFWLSDTPDVPGSALENAHFPRICTYAHLRNKLTGQEYVHVNVHLDHTGNKESSTANATRLAQATIMLRELSLRIPLHSLPVVITGDFNQTAHKSNGDERPIYKLLTGVTPFTGSDGDELFSPLGNTRADADTVTLPNGHTGTMVKHAIGKEPIDYVFYSKGHLDALTYETKLYNWDGVYLSDHLPVFAILSFQ